MRGGRVPINVQKTETDLINGRTTERHHKIMGGKRVFSSRLRTPTGGRKKLNGRNSRRQKTEVLKRDIQKKKEGLAESPLPGGHRKKIPRIPLIGGYDVEPAETGKKRKRDFQKRSRILALPVNGKNSRPTGKRTDIR